MPNGTQKRKRSERVAAVELPPGVFGRTIGYLRQGHILVRVGLCVCAALVLWGITGAWAPPLVYYEGYVPSRDIHASVEFEQPDDQATEEAKRQASDLALAVYSNDEEKLIQLRARLINTVDKILGANSVEAVGTDEWAKFLPLGFNSQDNQAAKKTNNQPKQNKPSPQESPSNVSADKGVSSGAQKKTTTESAAGKEGGSKSSDENSSERKDSQPDQGASGQAKSNAENPASESGENGTAADAVLSAKSPTEQASADSKPEEETAAVPVDPATQRFLEFKEALSAPGSLEKLQADLDKLFAPLDKHGLLDKLPDEHRGNQERILVHRQGRPQLTEPVSISSVLANNSSTALQERIDQEIESKLVAESVASWLKPQLPNTLTLDLKATLEQQTKAREDVPQQMKHYAVGAVLAKEGKPLDKSAVNLLRLEYQEILSQRTFTDKAGRSLAALGMYLGLFILCGFYIHRRQPELLTSLPRLFTMLCIVVLTVGLCVILDGWRAELVPLLLFSMAIAIAYQQELALLLAACVMLVAIIALGRDMTSGVTLMAATSGAVLMFRNVRSRTKLLFVGLGSGAVAFLATVGMGILMAQPVSELLLTGLLNFGLCVLAGALMTMLLPFIERIFNVLTDIRLLELGDAAHPLLQELIRRAPGTYNHSITVALLAEAAAEAIGARGLLVRVGAFFHDIGKMLKPGYFIENQGQGDNRHETLVPAMSTLVIIAHVKDGADLARQNRLPEPVIDFIQQHHGTTLVEYFYRRASEQKEAEEDGGQVDESSFRYPGPKPQTKEAGVLMLADAVESASRVLVEPTPARIESLVEEITMKRLLDGQFDECGLTLQEVHTVGESLVKSLTGVYHGRVKYPGQQTA